MTTTKFLNDEELKEKYLRLSMDSSLSMTDRVFFRKGYEYLSGERDTGCQVKFAKSQRMIEKMRDLYSTVDISKRTGLSIDFLRDIESGRRMSSAHTEVIYQAILSAHQKSQEEESERIRYTGDPKAYFEKYPHMTNKAAAKELGISE